MPGLHRCHYLRGPRFITGTRWHQYRSPPRLGQDKQLGCHTARIPACAQQAVATPGAQARAAILACAGFCLPFTPAGVPLTPTGGCGWDPQDGAPAHAAF